MAPEASWAGGRSGHGPAPAELASLFHQLNNQLGVILVNSELLEKRLADEGQRVRAGLVVTGALDAIGTVQHLRQLMRANIETASR